MKRILILAALAFLASAVTSCDDNGKINIPPVDVQIDATSDIHAEDLLGLKSQAVGYDSQSDFYYVENPASTSLQANVSLTTAPSAIPGSLEIDNSVLPDVAHLKDGSLEQSAIVLTVDNPSDEVVTIVGKASADDVVFTLPDVTLGAKSNHDVCFVSVNSSSLIVPGYTDPDYYVSLPEPGKAIDKGPAKIVVSDLGVSSVSSKAIAPAGGSYEFKVDAKYIAPLAYKAGSKIHLDRTFKDLNIALDRVNYPCSEYDIYMEVENTLPFDIIFTVSSSEGISGSLKNPIKAGSTKNPVTTSVVFNIKDSSGKAVSNINSADLGIDLTAAEGATLQKGQAIGLKVSKLSIINLF